MRCSADAEQYSCSGNVIYVSSKTFYCWKQKLNEQTSEKLWEMRESRMKEMGRDIGNISDYFILRQKPSTHGIYWAIRSLMPQGPLDAVTVQMYSLSLPFTGTALPATFLQEGMVAMTLALAGHSSLSHVYNPMKPKHTLKELLYSGASTSGRILDFKAYLHIYYNTSKSRFFLKGYSNICLPLMGTIPLAYVP